MMRNAGSFRLQSVSSEFCRCAEAEFNSLALQLLHNPVILGNKICHDERKFFHRNDCGRGCLAEFACIGNDDDAVGVCNHLPLNCRSLFHIVIEETVVQCGSGNYCGVGMKMIE